MSTREPQPGDVAMLTVNGGNPHRAMYVDELGWFCIHGIACGGKEVRTLVAIDPEDSRGFAVEIAQRVGSVVARPGEDISRIIAAVEDALRNLAGPPTPAEPTGLGAIVKDDDGEHWSRHKNGDWSCLNSPGGYRTDVHKWDVLVGQYGPVDVVYEGVK